jgi:ABC-type antimicrobial peptide transport system permease subunit
MLLVDAGITLGLPATLASTRLIANRLFGIAAADPLTIAIAVILMTAVAITAGFVPAQRASRVDPMIALRHD